MNSSASSETTPPLRSVGGHRLSSAPKTPCSSLPPDLSGIGSTGGIGLGGEGQPQEAGQLRRTWGTTELSRAFSDAHCTGKSLSATDRLLVTELYSMCHWPDVPAPPATATTYPVSYAFIGMRVGLRRSGAERAVERLRERGWVSTELDEESGYLIYTVHIGKILKDLESWGRWSIRDAIGGRAPSRRSRPGRSERWGHAPRPQHLRHRPRAMPIADLVDRWRGVWPDAPDPTATLAALLQEGATPKQLHRALDSLEASGLASPRPQYIRDRFERGAYLHGLAVPSDSPGEAASPPAGGEAPDALTDPREAAPEASCADERPSIPAGPWAPPPPDPAAAPAPFGVSPQFTQASPGSSGADRPDEAEHRRLAARLSTVTAAIGGGPSRRSPAPASANSPPGADPERGKPPDRNVNWTNTVVGNTTSAGEAPDRENQR